MLLQEPLRVEKRCPYWLSLGAAGVLLALAVCGAGVGLTAAAAGPAVPTTDDEEIVIKVVTGDQAIKNDDQKGVVVKKEQKLKNEKLEKTDVVLELETLLENLPQDVDKEQIRAEIKKAMEQLRKLTQELTKEKTEEATKKLKEAMKVQEGALKDVFKARDGAWQLSRNTAAQPAEGGRLGITAEKPSAVLVEQLDLPKGQGLVIDSVKSDSPAAKAGLKVNDVLLEVKGKAVTNEAAQLVRMLAEIKPGEAFDLLVLRKGRKETLKDVKLSETKKPAEAKKLSETKGRFGINVQPGQPGVLFNKEQGFPFNQMQFQAQGSQGVMTTTFRTDDRFTSRHQEGSLIITLTGKIADGKAKVNEIQVQDGNNNRKYDSLSRVPEQYRDKVKNLIEMNEKSNIKIDIKTRSRTTNKKDD